METPTIENPYDYKNIIHNSDKNTVKRLIVEQNREIEQLKNDIKNYGYRADSTGRVINDRVADITHMDEEISHLKGQISIYKQNIETEKLNNISIKEMAKTYENMKVAEIRNIVQQLDDQTIMKLYKNTGTRKRQNILLALGSSSAARITEKVVKDNLTKTEKDVLILEEQIKELESDNFNKQSEIDSLSIELLMVKENLINLVESDIDTENQQNPKDMKNK